MGLNLIRDYSPKPKWSFAQSLACSPFQLPDITKLLLKRDMPKSFQWLKYYGLLAKTQCHLSILVYQARRNGLSDAIRRAANTSDARTCTIVSDQLRFRKFKKQWFEAWLKYCWLWCKQTSKQPTKPTSVWINNNTIENDLKIHRIWICCLIHSC